MAGETSQAIIPGRLRSILDRRFSSKPPPKETGQVPSWKTQLDALMPQVDALRVNGQEERKGRIPKAAEKLISVVSDEDLISVIHLMENRYSKPCVVFTGQNDGFRVDLSIKDPQDTLLAEPGKENLFRELLQFGPGVVELKVVDTTGEDNSYPLYQYFRKKPYYDQVANIAQFDMPSVCDLWSQSCDQPALNCPVPTPAVSLEKTLTCPSFGLLTADKIDASISKYLAEIARVINPTPSSPTSLPRTIDKSPEFS